MVRALAGKEFREALRSVRFLAVALTSCLLIPLTIFVNTRAYEQRSAYHEELVGLWRTQAQTAGLRADLSVEGFRRPSVLGILFRGVEPSIPARVQTSRDGLFTVLSEIQQADPAASSSDLTDLGFLTSVVLSLLAFVFVHGVITREKEDGTLKLLVSTGAPRRSILLGKLLGCYGAFTLPVALGLAFGLGTMLSSPVVRAHMEGEWVPLSMGVLSLFCLLAVLFLLAAFVSMFAHRSGVAIVLLLFLWVFMVLAPPRMAPMIAEIVHPQRPRDIVELEKRLMKVSADIAFRGTADSLYNAVLSRHGVDVDTVEMVVPQLLRGNARLAHEEYERELTGLEAAHLSGLHGRWSALDSAREAGSGSRQRLASVIAHLSPTGTFNILAATLAGTGLDEWERSLDFARGFQKQVNDELYARWVVRLYGANRSITMPVGGVSPPPVDRGRLMAVLPPSRAAERARASVPEILILAAMAVSAAIGCALKFRSYDAR